MSCHLSKRVKGECDKCGIVPPQLHMPEDVHGWYCAACCPVCQPQRQTAPVETKESTLQAA
jgi:hypothetical protein